MSHYKNILNTVRNAGFAPHGGFHVETGDAVPDIHPGKPARTVVLVGNVGPDMWQHFSSECNPATDLLDEWSSNKLGTIAKTLDAVALLPSTKPHHPFQRWAQKTQTCHTSPLGILIHNDYGLWHGYRGALAFEQRLSLPPLETRPNPCDSCLSKPCLTSCPVSAFSSKGYNVAACTDHISAPAGRQCMKTGCQARCACPNGRHYIYGPEQMKFHMTAFQRAMS